jgi:hypothetical protein
MLITTSNLPMNNGGFPWGTTLVVVVLIVGVSYVGYRLSEPTIIPNPKNVNNDRK